MRVSKWGSSLAVRIPRAMVEALKLKAGDEIDITISQSRPARMTRRSRAKALAGLRKYRGRMPADFRSDPRFLRRIEKARKSLRAGRGVRLEDL